MSESKVPVVRIDAINPIEGADNIVAAQVGGYQCVVLKSQFQIGDLAVYVPEGYIVPDNVLEAIGLKGKLSGSQKNRVKAIKLRKCLSQGLLIDQPTAFTLCSRVLLEGDDASEALGIKKWEPVLPAKLAAGHHKAVRDTLKYDFENLKWYEKVMVEGEEVVMTEKVHGTFCEIAYVPHLVSERRWYQFFTVGCERAGGATGFFGGSFGRTKADRSWWQKLPILKHMIYEDLGFIGMNKNFMVTSKGLAAKGVIIPDTKQNENNLYLRVAKDIVDRLEVQAFLHREPFYVLGEIYGDGVQDLTYGMKNGEVGFVGFDVYEGRPGQGRFLDYDEKSYFFAINGINMVPTVYRGPYTRELAAKHRDGKTILGGGAHIREGVVVTPVEERKSNDMRVIFKDVSEAYLLRSSKDATEYQ